MRVMIIIWLLLFSVILKVQFDKKLSNHECDSIVVTVPVMQTDYLCFIGGEWVRCDPDKMASEEPAKD